MRKTLFVAAGLLGLVVLLSVAVISFPAVTRTDEAINAFFAHYREAPMLSVFSWITALGTRATLVAVMLTATSLLWIGGRTALVAGHWVSYLGAEATTWGAKYAIDRQRPIFTTAATAVSPSFPSAHSAGSAAVYGFLAYVVARAMPSDDQRIATFVGVCLLVSLVGFSRVFLGVHYASDVVAGLMVGACWVLIATLVAEAGCARLGR